MPDCRGRHMNKRPVSYLQTDSRWAKKPYRVPGENSTIGDSGCGPTAAAMLIETLTGKTLIVPLLRQYRQGLNHLFLIQECYQNALQPLQHIL